MVFKSLSSFKSISYVPSVTPTNIEIRIITGFFFGLTTRLVGFYFVKQGLNLGLRGESVES